MSDNAAALALNNAVEKLFQAISLEIRMPA
jgi:hypothetical protein